MDNQYDYKKFAVLYVDDEERSLTNFARAFGDEFRIFTAPNAQAGFKIFEQHADEIGILMTDQRMPGEKGVWLLERARQLRPRVLRILVTAFADMDAAIAAVNTGAIYKYVSKPWDPQQLDMTLKQGLEFFLVSAERDQLLREKMSVLRNMMIADRIVSLGLLAAGLSHHIKNSMVAVKTFLELAPMKMNEEKASTAELRDPDFWRDYHSNVQGQIEKINNLLADLRSASENNKNGEPFPDEITLKTAVTQRLDGLREAFTARRIVVDNQIPDSLPKMLVDRPKFDRLFDLLFKDELAMLPAGSQIVINAEVQGKDIAIKLADNGPALPPAALQVVLDPFTVTSGVPSEYGINLMACFFIAHHHGGKIEAASHPGGNLFTVRLPIKPERQVAAPAEDADFMKRALLNDNLWDKLLTSG
ncbi:MAG TPA: hybrid sensor histidine kinase/response regulator [Verrucomicrobiae bacterium]|nr:hybrid sensor histidine kinase/response regulator [Verrucomicrobiae bacterium]